jgi:sugar O-acyltransferase (sialic acid O-acetyltransferase NeuD family)
MLIAGAGGFARQVLSTLHSTGIDKSCVFFDDFTPNPAGIIPANFILLRTSEDARAYFADRNGFILATGNPKHRSEMCNKLESLGGKPNTLTDPSVVISPYSTNIDEGCTILHGVVIESGVKIGKGVLLNLRALVTHDCEIGDFSEISPAAVLLGGSRIGKLCMIGAGAVILPGIHIGDRAVIGAGAVVTADVAEGETRVGVPARMIQKH